MTLIVFLKVFFGKANLEKKSADDNNIMDNYPASKELTTVKLEIFARVLFIFVRVLFLQIKPLGNDEITVIYRYR